MSNFTWDSSPDINLKSIQDLKQKYNRHYMRTLEKMTSHSAKIPIKSLAEYCFLLAAGIVKHQKRSKYIYKTSCCRCRSAVRCSASSHRERADSHLLQVKHWQGISTSQTSHQKTPAITSRDQYKKNVCVSKYIDVWIATGPENWVLRIFLSTFYSWEWSFMGYICWEMKRNNKSWILKP